MKKDERLKIIFVELVHHLPYSIFGVAIALIVMGGLSFFAVLLNAQVRLPQASEDLFHVFHSTHVLFSALATTAMFWKHEKKVPKALCVGFFGSIVIGTLSDILFPYFGGKFLGSDMHLHISVLEEPMLILPFAAVGVFGGFMVTEAIEKSTQYTHSLHVLISSAASILYLMAFGVQDWTHQLGSVFIVTLFAVMIPCCLSDIAFPLYCAHRGCKHK